MVIKNLADVTQMTVETIHESKITIPPVIGIPRPSLVARIEQGVQGPLTVVSAQAGWGKTTLLAEWASQTAMNVAWVSLDESDANPTHFFRSVVAALDGIYPMRLDDVFAMLRSPRPAIDELIHQAILSRLEDIHEHTAIILDDIHVLTHLEQLRSFECVLEQLPAIAHFVLGTRGDLPFRLARLRMDGAVTEVNAIDLAFSVSEANSSLERSGCRVPNLHDVEALVERTEGWIAGLRLAAISLGAHREPRDVIARFSGSHRDITDYFREEVLNALDPDMKQFLVETSVLERFTDSLINTMTGRADAHELLQGSQAPPVVHD